MNEPEEVYFKETLKGVCEFWGKVIIVGEEGDDIYLVKLSEDDKNIKRALKSEITIIK